MRRRRAKIAQGPLAKEVWIALALLCKVDDSLGDYFDGEVVSIVKPEGYAHHLERDAHDTYGFGIGFVAV